MSKIILMLSMDPCNYHLRERDVHTKIIQTLAPTYFANNNTAKQLLIAEEHDFDLANN